jgi:hypothetical protein
MKSKGIHIVEEKLIKYYYYIMNGMVGLIKVTFIAISEDINFDYILFFKSFAMNTKYSN